jgi:hypothetical protein
MVMAINGKEKSLEHSTRSAIQSADSTLRQLTNLSDLLARPGDITLTAVDLDGFDWMLLVDLKQLKVVSSALFPI